MRSFLVLAACLALPACASPKYGEGDSAEVFSREGGYVSAAGITGFEKSYPVGAFDGSGNGKGGAGIRIGYRGENDTATELFVEDSRGFTLDSPAGSTKVEFQSLGLNGKVFLAEGRVQPFFLIGAGWTRVLFSDRTMFNPSTGASLDVPYRSDALLGHVGLGIDFHLSKRVALFVEGDYQYFMFTELNDFNHIDLLAGITIRF